MASVSSWSVTSATATTSGSAAAAADVSARRVRSEVGSAARRRGASQGSAAVSAANPA